VPNPYFKFKQFTVVHHRCAMKVNTDGCLLGSWAEAEKPENILDIGTGSGVIALMLAQKYVDATVTGVEIEKKCAQQCAQNFSDSPFSERLNCCHSAIQNFTASTKYDLIVSNPPYFEKDTPAKEQQRHQARHQETLHLDELFKQSANLLSGTGHFCLILPIQLASSAMRQANRFGFYVHREVVLRPLPQKAPHRVLFSFSFVEANNRKDEVIIEQTRGMYSQTVAAWLKPYYLNL
jgi:tRNA1Val (adenine37-N6)-methyltransferase